MKAVTRICLIALVMLLMTVPLGACGPTAPPDTSPDTSTPTEPDTTTPTDNQPPVISSLTAEPTIVTYGGTSQLTCTASDPDGDQLSYSWTATGGTIRENVTLATWTAPQIDGDFVITVTVVDPDGRTASASSTVTVQANMRPVISSLTADPSELIPGDISTITCTANDPEGDTLHYQWSAEEGSISGTGNVITWQAPDTDGKYVISVVVDDGKGGTVRNETTVTVTTPEMAVTLNPVTSESGTVSFAGDLSTDWLVGDNAANMGQRTFFSFDISDLSGATIDEAKLTFATQEIVGNPWGISVFLHTEKVEYGSRPLEATDFDIDGTNLEKFTSEVPEEIDVTLALSKLLKPPAKLRFQVRMRLDSYTNGNSQEDYIEFSDAVLTVNYTR